jgi:amino acid adenylation domain-containing protein
MGEQHAADRSTRVKREARIASVDWPGGVGTGYTARLSGIYWLLKESAALDPTSLALAAPGRSAVSYGRLLQQVEETAGVLNAAGLGRGDRIAAVLPNGPDMAAAFLAVAAGAVCAPLNPAYREAEFAFYLSDLKPRALIVDAEAPAAALAAADTLRIPIVRLVPFGECGIFRLEHSLEPRPAANGGYSKPEDPALVLHTSGTTSRPKLVVLTNANLWRSARNIRESLALTAADRCLNVMPLFHIHGLAAAVLASVAAGGSVVCTPGFVGTRFFEWLEEFAPTWYTAVPTMHQAIVARAEENRDVIARRPLRFIRSCSAALPPKVLADLERAFQAPVIEAYGMTEAAHQVASNPLPPGARKPGSVGKAAGPEVAIAPDGEVIIRGLNVTPGYDQNPEANRAAFDGGWFRTGDRGWIDEDGYLFLSGRTKEMINRGGEKISPREIDEALLEHPAVAQALAFAMPDARLGEDVAAAVVLREGAAATDMELREFAAARLADFKVPRRIVFLAEIPKGPTGKPQRIGLAERLHIEPEAPAAAEHVAPRTPTESMLCALWQSLLKIERVGVRDNFFDLGGDSVLAAQMLARAAVPPLVFYAAPTVEAMAGWLDSGRRPAALLVKGARAAEAPLSFAQERIWFLEQLEGAQAPYVRLEAYRLRGPLEESALKRSLDAIVERHEALRTTFHNRQGTPVQVIGPPRPVALEDDVRRPFDLERDLMLRASLERHGADDHTLTVAMHHIASDGWSGRVFLRELAALYRGEALPPLPLQYADYARWQRAQSQDEELAAYWKQNLAGLPPLLDLPTDRPRPPRQSFRGARESIALPAAVADLARAERATLFMTLAAALAALLNRYTASEDIAVGCPSAGRSRVETEGLIGLFVNTLVLRAGLSGDPTFRELLARVREAALGAYAHEAMPFERLVEMLDPPRSLAYSPLFQVMFQLRNLPFEKVSLGDVKVEPVEADPGMAPFDLCFDVAPETLRCTLDYNTDLFDAATARRMLGHYATLIESAVADPGRRISAMPMLTESERRQVLVEWNRTERADAGEGASLVDLFEAQARRTPDAVAVSAGAEKWTYLRLNAESDRLARHLRSLGVKPEVVVGVCLERSPRAVMALLAILKTGGVFLPLDPAYPAERLSFMLEDSGAQVLVSERKALARLPKQLPRTALVDEEWNDGPRERAPGGGPVYVIYTSGSTGKPNGVLGLERGLLNRLRWMWRKFPYEPAEVCCQRTPLSFVDSVAEIFGPLLKGVRLEIIPDDLVKGSQAELVRALERSGATRIVLVPSLLAAILEERPRLPRLKMWFTSGETLTSELAARFARLVPHGRLINLYGSSEVSADITWHEANGTAGIGRPIDNTEVYVLDAHGEPAPVGVPGELYAGGAGLARGYLNRPDLTARRFVESPWGRLFRTGDRARWLPDGTLEFLGRADGQVKLRGCRVELGEVEAALERHPLVEAAVAAVRGESLTAYVRSVEGLNAPALRDFAGQWLPDYMVPNRVVFLKEFPLLPNGKVNRRALPAPGRAAQAAAAPRDETEARLARIWQELLGHGPVGIHDNFFDLGGHSLLAARMAARIAQELGKPVGIRTLFEAQTVAQLAGALRNGTHTNYPRLFWVGGGPFLGPMLERMANAQQIIALTFDEQDGEQLREPYTVPDVAAVLAERLRAFQRTGPYYLGGYSLQGLYAWELARQLRERGEDVRLLVLVDTFLSIAARQRLGVLSRASAHAASFAKQIAEARFKEVRAHALALKRVLERPKPGAGAAAEASLRDKLRAAAIRYIPGPAGGRVVFFEAESQPLGRDAGACFGWAELMVSGWKVIRVPGNHETILGEALARELEACLRASRDGADQGIDLQPPDAQSEDL